LQGERPLIERDADRWARAQPVNEQLLTRQHEDREAEPGLVTIRTARALLGKPPIHPARLFPHGRRAPGRRYEYREDAWREDATTFMREELLVEHGPVVWRRLGKGPFTPTQLEKLARYAVHCLLPVEPAEPGEDPETAIERARLRRERVEQILATQPRGPAGPEAYRLREEAKDIRAALAYGLLSFYGASADDVAALLGVGRARIRQLEEKGRRLCESAEGEQLDPAERKRLIEAAKQDRRQARLHRRQAAE
jgi:hypothetical protein